MASNFAMVGEFHAVFCPDQTAPAPAIVNDFTWQLRQKLIEEEYSELKAAHNQQDIVGVADALADLLYVVYGTALAYGIDIDTIFREVHVSNMSKLGMDGQPVRNKDGKVIKGPNYVPPRIDQLLRV